MANREFTNDKISMEVKSWTLEWEYVMKYIGKKLKSSVLSWVVICFVAINALAVSTQGSNVVYISDNITAPPDSSVTVPITIIDATGVAAVGIKLSYNASVVNVTGATNGSFFQKPGDFFAFDNRNSTNGWVTINTYITGTDLTGNVTIANLTLKAVGKKGSTSHLNLSVLAMSNQYGVNLPRNTSNGTFSIINQPPVLTSIGDKTVNEGQTLVFTISATDPDGDTLTYSAANIPAGAVFNALTRNFSWTPASDQSGTYPDVQFRVSDGTLVDSENITITVNNVNNPPSINGLVNQSGNINTEWSYDISSKISDPEGDILTVTTNDNNISVTGFVLRFNYSVVVTNKPVIVTVSDGLLSSSQTIFVSTLENTLPLLTNPSSSQLIPDDTDGTPLWGETSILNITATDTSGIASVSINLSAIGRSTVQPMVNIDGNIWSVTTNASAGTPNQTYQLRVNATDIYGNSNNSVSIPLVVMRNGDVDGNNQVNIVDAMLLANYVSFSGMYVISNEFVSDVAGNGIVDIADAMLLANSVSYPDQGYILR